MDEATTPTGAALLALSATPVNYEELHGQTRLFAFDARGGLAKEMKLNIGSRYAELPQHTHPSLACTHAYSLVSTLIHALLAAREGDVRFFFLAAKILVH